MTNKEKLIAIIGEDNFRKFEANLAIKGKDPIFYIHNYGINVLILSFCWLSTNEGPDFWRSLHEKLIKEWYNFGLREISPEEQDLLFKMFCTEWMEYPQGNNERWYEIIFDSGLGLKIYEALREAN